LPAHSITSSARPSSENGKFIPSVLAVLTLMTSSTFVACITGRSAGFSPFRMRLVHPDIKPENPPERSAHYLDVPNMPWETTKFPGIKIKVLYTDDTGITTALFKLEPGAVVPLHEHTALEQTYVIEGSLEDHEGKCGPGQFVWRPAGNQHEAIAPNGAVLLGFFLKPNRFAYGEKFFTAPGER
jgi:quercetin dioxygenase-like cupin family protein